MVLEFLMIDFAVAISGGTETMHTFSMGIQGNHFTRVKILCMGSKPSDHNQLDSKGKSER